MSSSDSKQMPNRRALLKGFAVAGTAVTAAAAGAATVAGQADTAAAEGAPPQTAKGYRETPHVREYYRKARF